MMSTRGNRVAMLGLLGLAFMFLQGCASGPPFAPVTNIPEDKGLVYLYRPKTFVGCGVMPAIKANNQEVVTLKAGNYYPYFCDPSEVEFSSRTESKTAVTLDITPGSTHYVKQTIGVGFFIGRPHLTAVSENVGGNEITKCRLKE